MVATRKDKYDFELRSSLLSSKVTSFGKPSTWNSKGFWSGGVILPREIVFGSSPGADAPPNQNRLAGSSCDPQPLTRKNIMIPRMAIPIAMMVMFFFVMPAILVLNLDFAIKHPIFKILVRTSLPVLSKLKRKTSPEKFSRIQMIPNNILPLTD
ncbi:MAG: hypothetical protein BWX90_00126 [bacterium ADurb.Bin132]|jgi:hypothetical protein|nr:MAG: hypothetical protein BWX90_00126 [bacterium ADurb.Bin132]